MSVKPLRREWARTGVVLGMVLTGTGFLLSIASETTQDGPVLFSYLAGGLEYLIFIVTVPLVYFAGRSARRSAGVTGDEGLFQQFRQGMGLPLPFHVVVGAHE